MAVVENQLAVEEVASDAAAPVCCPNCGNAAPERFCPRCGEQRINDKDFSLRGYLGEALNVLTNVESNVLRSFAALIARPGHLTAEYFAGRRKRYLKPLQLFLFCNLIYFFAQSYTGANTLTTPLYVHLNMLPYSESVRGMVYREVEERRVDFDDYQLKFNAVIQNQAKTLVILMIPAFTLGAAALNWRRRPLFVAHLVFATHFFSFLLLLLTTFHLAVSFLLRRLHALGLPVPESDLLYTTIILFACGVYLFHASKRMYAQGRAATLLKCVLLVVWLGVVVQSYRLALFFTTFYSI